MLKQLDIDGTFIKRRGHINLTQLNSCVHTTYKLHLGCECRECRVPLWRRVLRALTF